MFIPSGAKQQAGPYSPGVITGPSDYIVRVSAQDPTTMFSDAGRTTQANVNDTVRSWVQVDATATQDVFDDWTGSTPPVLVDLGTAKALHFTVSTSRIKQNAYDNTATLNTVLPTGSEPYFMWSVVQVIDTFGGTSYMLIGDPATGSRATIGYTPIGPKFQANNLNLDAAPTGTSFVVFAWYDGTTLYGQVNEGTVYTTVTALNVGTNGTRSRGIQFGHPEFFTKQFYLLSAGMYNYVLSDTERAGLYQELVLENNL